MGQLGTVVVVGVGLIGGSVGLTIRARSLAGRVIGVGRSEASLAEAAKVGALDEYTLDLREAVAGADVVVVCTPVSLVASAVLIASRHGPSNLLITDAGSTKRIIVETVEQTLQARAMFVGGHPIAGSERKGAAHADGSLFDGRVCVLTPTISTPSDRLERARAFWSALGCRVVELNPTTHDEMLALTSHLPHALAAALAATVPFEALGLAAGAYRDGTRVAGADAELWSSIFLQNRDPLLRAIACFEDQFATFRAALETGDDGVLQSWWRIAQSRRLQFEAGQDRPAVEH